MSSLCNGTARHPRLQELFASSESGESADEDELGWPGFSLWELRGDGGEEDKYLEQYICVDKEEADCGHGQSVRSGVDTLKELFASSESGKSADEDELGWPCFSSWELLGDRGEDELDYDADADADAAEEEEEEKEEDRDGAGFVSRNGLVTWSSRPYLMR